MYVKMRDAPSLILATPGCAACEEIGALLAGVFCGVLQNRWYQQFLFILVTLDRTYGAVGRSSFLLRIGSDMLK